MDGLIWSVIALAGLVAVMMAICPARHGDKTARRQ